MSKGWFKVYWDFLDNLTPESALLLAYLIEIEPIMKNREGDFFRLSNSFIQERFLTWSDYTIKSKLDELVSKGYIEQEQKFKVEHSRGCKTRWIKLKFNPEDNTEDNPKDNPNNKPKNFGIKENKENKEKEEIKDNNGETSSPTVKKSSSDNSSSKRKSRKDQLVEYVHATAFTEETKDTLFKWIFQIGLKGNVTVDQLKDMLKKIWNECSGNELLVREAINNSYLNNWFGFFAPKKSGNFSENKPSNHLTLGNNKTPAQPNAQGSKPKLHPTMIF